MPLVSVVVPVYNVAGYVEQCLDSIAAQTWRDLDVVVVDDGSTDGSGELAARYADRDPRFRVVRTDNHGLGHARNVGLTHARGDLLCFADSDDVVPFRAYELLHAALDRSGSDFATGNFRRLTALGTRAAKYVGTTYSTQRLGTHIRRHRDLVVDRTAWNKMFRREFWQRHEFRFAEGGVQYEDQYATLPAHFLASSVDVVSSPIYFWRIREDESSISQRRAEPGSLRDRIAAIAATSEFLASSGFAADKPWYEQSVLAQDLGYFLDAIDAMADADRLPLLAQVGAWLDQADHDVFDRLPAVRRVGWHLARTGRLDELAELLRFEREGGAAAPPVRRRGGQWYGDYPFFGDRSVAVPDELYRLDDDLRVDSVLTATELAGSSLRITGRAALWPLPGARLRPPQVDVRLVPAAGGDPLPLQVRPAPVPAYDEDGAALDPRRLRGYVAELDVRSLPTNGTWRLEVEVRSRGEVRTTQLHPAAALRLLGPHRAVLGGRRQVRIEHTGRDALLLHVEKPKVAVAGVDFADGCVVVAGTAWGEPADATLEVTREAGRRLVVPVGLTPETAARSTFTASIPVSELGGGLDSPIATEGVRRQRLEVWELALRVAGVASRLAPPPDLPDRTWSADGVEWRAEVGRAGRLVLVHRAPRPVLTAVEAGTGTLVLTVTPAGSAVAGGDVDVVLADRTGDAQPLPPMVSAGPHGDRLRLDPLRLPPGRRDLLVRTTEGQWPLAVSTDLADRLPLEVSAGGVRVTLGLVGSAAPAVSVVQCAARDGTSAASR